MDGGLIQFGVPGILALLILKEVFGFVKARRSNEEELPLTQVREQTKLLPGLVADQREMKAELHELWDLHKKTDEDGVPVWYVRRSLEHAIKNLSDNIAEQTKLLASLVADQREIKMAISHERLERK